MTGISVSMRSRELRSYSAMVKICDSSPPVAASARLVKTSALSSPNANAPAAIRNIKISAGPAKNVPDGTK